MSDFPESEVVTALVEVILCHREIGAAVHCAGCDWESDGSGPAMESFTRHQLDAILTATDDEECPACGGWGLRNRRNPVTGEPERLCLVCNGTKRVPGKPLIIAVAVEAGIDVVDALVKLGVLEQIGWGAPRGRVYPVDTDWRGFAHGKRPSYAAAVYAATQTEEG